MPGYERIPLVALIARREDHLGIRLDNRFQTDLGADGPELGEQVFSPAERDDLADVLARANRAVGTRTALPVLQGLLCEVSGSTLRVTGTDLDMTVRTQAEVEVMEEGRAVIPPPPEPLEPERRPGLLSRLFGGKSRS